MAELAAAEVMLDQIERKIDRALFGFRRTLFSWSLSPLHRSMTPGLAMLADMAADIALCRILDHPTRREEDEVVAPRRPGVAQLVRNASLSGLVRDRSSRRE